MPPDDDLKHLMATVNLMQMEQFPFRDGGEMKKKDGIMIQFVPHESGKVPHPCFTRMYKEICHRLGKPVYRSTWDAPNFSGEGWFFEGDKRMLKLITNFLNVHEVKIGQNRFWSGGE